MADLVSTLEDLVPGIANEAILVGEISVSRVLHKRISQTVSDSQTLKVELQAFLLVQDIVTDGGNVMAGITLTSDVKISSIERRILLKEAIKEINHVSGNLILGFELMALTGVRVTSTNRLVNVKQVSLLVPGVLIGLKDVSVVGRVLLELERTVLVESGDLRGTARATSKPDDKRISLRARARLEHPVEHIVSLVVHLSSVVRKRDET